MEESINIYTDEALVKGCLENDRKFQEYLYKRYASKMYGICLNYCSDNSAAKDVLQEGFIKVFKKIKSYQFEGKLEVWIRKIITNTAIDYYRKNSRLNKYLEDKIPEDNYYEVNETILSQLCTQDILNNLKKLPEGARIIFNLYVIEGFTHKEISEKLQISEGTSKSQYSRARSLLKNLLIELEA